MPKKPIRKSSRKKKKVIRPRKPRKPRIDNPLSEYENVCDSGIISKNKPNPNFVFLNNLLGELHDVYCVATNKKPLAALDFSAHGRRKLKSENVIIKNKVIKYCNDKNVEAIHNTKRGGMYLKTIFFLPKNYNNALKLMKILWYPAPEMDDNEYQMAVGLLLGYSKQNIKYFLKEKYHSNVSLRYINEIQKQISEMTVSLEDLQSSYKVVHLKSIKLL